MGDSDPPLVAEARLMAKDLMWSDPAEDESHLDSYGFAPNPDRGPMQVRYGQSAIDAFLRPWGGELIIRAHEMKQEGLRISKQAKVVTVFTSSNYSGGDNGAAAIFVSDGKLRFICHMADHFTPSTVQRPQASAMQHALGEVPVR
eukprot:NODE_5730_length_555_cov_51.227273_g4992_i0.p1 GENE.NODE_5730_length_555_cov_51.227273_g4992_i0~~NODE_5730_length_555_cov_51.227273_g4992_i0.p1  ORF type:complete len:145 (-),score=47.81 NODE_5730_length_555_cov_51.227273_g4992_i0:92-526(-)